jgi:hypothetical protein
MEVCPACGQVTLHVTWLLIDGADGEVPRRIEAVCINVMCPSDDVR